MRARDPAADRELADAVRDALTLAQAQDVRVDGAEGEIWVHFAPMPAEEDDPYQLLRAVVLLSRAARLGAGAPLSALERRIGRFRKMKRRETGVDCPAAREYGPRAFDRL